MESVLLLASAGEEHGEVNKKYVSKVGKLQRLLVIIITLVIIIIIMNEGNANRLTFILGPAWPATTEQQACNSGNKK